jgi:hypothetical protein
VVLSYCPRNFDFSQLTMGGVISKDDLLAFQSGRGLDFE